MANPRGQQRDKPFREALRMELAAAGGNHKALREVAKTLIGAAMSGELPAIKEIADRMDGKPAQTTDVTLHRVDPATVSDSELAAVIASDGSEDSPSTQVH